MKRILLVHTGGTLGMTGRRPAALKPGAFFRTLREKIPELTRLAHVELELFSNIDSCEMQPELWCTLARHLYERLADFDGAVVTHGTDTMAMTASALSFMLPGLNKPIVLTGAQRPLGEVRSDARMNLVDAVTSAVHGPREVTVCFDSHLYRGNRVQKVSVQEYNAFDSPNHPPLGTLGVETQFEKGLKPRGRFRLMDRVDPRIFVLRVFPGLDPQLAIDLLPSLRGLVVEAYGVGTFPISEGLGRSLLPVFRQAKALDVPVLMVTQARRYGIDLSMYESGVAARRLWAISGGDMTLPAAVVKLMHGLAWHRGQALRRYLETPVSGERSEG